MTLEALHHIRSMRGRTRPQLMYCENDAAYIVKFACNPLGPHVLACDYLATRLADWAGLPVALCEPIRVARFLINNTEELSFFKSYSEEDRVHFGSRLIGGVNGGTSLIDILPESSVLGARGVEAFASMLALDKWCSNRDARQAIFSCRRGCKDYRVHFIDQGDCFGGSLSTANPERDHGLYRQRGVYTQVTAWDDFEPVLTRITSIPPDVILNFAREMPGDWYSNNWNNLESLIDALLRRRTRIHELIVQLRDCEASVFPNWQRRSSIHFSSRSRTLSLCRPVRQI